MCGNKKSQGNQYINVHQYNTTTNLKSEFEIFDDQWVHSHSKSSKKGVKHQQISSIILILNVS